MNEKNDREIMQQDIPRNQCGEACERAKLCAVCLAEMTKQPEQPGREWQGLTDEDLSVCDEDGVLLARYWESKLKEKNT